jgi:cytochrome c biogenesis protein CcdA
VAFELTLPMVAAAGLIDGINPCAFGVLVLLMAYLSRTKFDKAKLFRICVTYITAVFLAYYVAGLGLLRIVTSLGISIYAYYLIAIIAFIAGILEIKDFFWYGRGIFLGIPAPGLKLIKKQLKKTNLVGAFVLGFVVAAVELPCTGAVYLAILTLMTNQAWSTAVWWLFIYNLAFIIPLVALFVIAYQGTKIKKIEAWRAKYRRWMRLITGLLLIALSLWMLIEVNGFGLTNFFK